MARGNGGRRIYQDHEDRRRFLNFLIELKACAKFELFSFCLMSNHFHLLMRLREISLSRIMHRLLGRYSRSFNKRHEISGHLFQGRFKSIPCREERYLRELIRYIDFNPVRAGIVTDPADWNWSSHAVYLGSAKSDLVDQSFALELFDGDRRAARESYREFVLEGIETPALVIDPFHPAAQGKNSPPILPKRKQATFAPTGRSRESIEERAMRLSKEYGVRIDALKGPSSKRNLTAIRKILVLESLNDGQRPIDLARFLNRSHTAIHNIEHAASRNQQPKVAKVSP